MRYRAYMSRAKKKKKDCFGRLQVQWGKSVVKVKTDWKAVFRRHSDRNVTRNITRNVTRENTGESAATRGVSGVLHVMHCPRRLPMLCRL